MGAGARERDQFGGLTIVPVLTNKGVSFGNFGIMAPYEQSQSCLSGGTVPASIIDKHLGQRIRIARDAAAMSQAELADLTGLDLEHIAAMEAGRIRVSSLALARIARSVNQSLDWFFDGLSGQDEIDAGARD